MSIVTNSETVTPEMLEPIATPSESTQEAVTPPVVEDAADESADQQTSESDADEVEEEQTETKPKRESGFNKRIRELVDERNQERAERQKLTQQLADALQGKSPPKQEVPQTPIDSGEQPKLENFQKYEDYLDARADWSASQRIKAMQADQIKQQQAYQQQQAIYEQHRQSLEQQAKLRTMTTEAEKKYPDFYEKVFDESVSIPPLVGQALLDSEKGQDLMYYLATNKAEADRIAKLSPSRQLVELGKLESNLPTIQKSKAPTPVTPVNGRKATASDGPRDTDDMEAWVKKEEARLKASR